MKTRENYKLAICFVLVVLTPILFLRSIDAYGQCENGLCLPPGIEKWEGATEFRGVIRGGRNGSAVATKAHPAVCRIYAEREIMMRGRRAKEACVGTGVLIWRGPSRGVVLTVEHLFRQRSSRVIVIFPNGEKHDAETVQTDDVPDLGALTIPRPNVEPMRISEDPPANAGDWVTLCGYEGETGSYRTIQGVVTGYASHKTPSGATTPHYDLTVTGEALDGQSGGPIINSKGELVAIIWGTDGRKSYGTYAGKIEAFLTSDTFKAPWSSTNRGLPWNARTEQEKIRADAGAYTPAQRQPMVPVAPASGVAGYDGEARRMAQDALNQVGSLSARVDAAHKEATGAIAATKSVAEKADEATAGLAVLEKGLAERIFSGVKAYTFGLLKSWGLPGGIVMTGVIAIGFFFVRKKLNRVAQIIDWITDKIPGQWDDKLIDPLVYKAASLVSGKPIPDYAHDPGFDAFGRPIPGYQAPVPVQPVAPPAAVVVPPPQPTAKEAELLAQIEVLKAAKG